MSHHEHDHGHFDAAATTWDDDPAKVERAHATAALLRDTLDLRGTERVLEIGGGTGQLSLALAADVAVYFCDPRSPWQRGSNENTNRLLRQYLPHRPDMSVHSQAQFSAIARQLNERPRKTLLYRTPAETFAECVAAIS